MVQTCQQTQKEKEKEIYNKKQTNKQKTGLATTYTNTEILFRLLNKDKIVLHPLKKRCCAMNKCNFFPVIFDYLMRTFDDGYSYGDFKRLGVIHLNS